MSIKIIDVEIKEIRFLISGSLEGSDGMSPESNYSAVYVNIKTNKVNLERHKLAFVIGRGNDLFDAAIQA